MKLLLRIILGIALALLHAWAIAALWIDGPETGRVALAVVYALVIVGSAIGARIFRFPPAVSLLAFALVLAWWLTLEPSNDRDWTADVARPARVEIDGDLVTIHNVRNFDYRSEEDFTEHWETRTYDLTKLQGVDMFLSTWGSPYIAHTIASWDFGGDEHLAISIETRKEKSESYSAILGFFRQFELYYVVADERDVVGVRTNYRDETVRLYRLAPSPEVARAILLDYLAELDTLTENPVWYNALTHNCTTTIRHHVQHVAKNNPFDWRILVNGFIDELGYERGTVDTSLPFEELRRVSLIGERALAAEGDPLFSTKIREGLPGSREKARP